MSVFANIEFRNEIASPLSPCEFIRYYVFGDRGKVFHIGYNKESETDTYEVYNSVGRPIKVMTIIIKNIEQK